MALEHILKKIREETDVKLSEIDSRIKKRVEEVMKEGEGEIAKLRENLLHEAEGRIKEEKRSKLAIARLDFRKALLTEKRLLLDKTFQAAFNDIRNLSDDDYRNLVKKFILQLAEPGNGKIFISTKDRKIITESLINEINKTLHKMDKSITLELAKEEVNIDGGFILKMGKIEINCSLSSLFKKKSEELETEISGILFPSSEGKKAS
jgi:V/A-type H+-transporting ATPase subunit E